MKAALRSLGLAGLCATLFALTAQAQYYYQQYYTPWYSYNNYYYRYYYYQPAGYNGYRYHYCYYYPSYQPNYYYFYNPYTSLYWGRSPVKSGGKQLYSILDPKDRKKNLKDIDEKAFPEPAAPPPIPETKGNTRMLMPPNDLPPQARPAR